MRVVAWSLRKKRLMPRQYPPHFRRDMVNRTVPGETVLCLVQETSVPDQTLHRWKHQALVGQGLVDGVNSAECAELRAANKRIEALEKELQLVKDASELFGSQAVAPPKKTAARSLWITMERPFDSFRHSFIGGEQVKLWLPDATQTSR